MTSRTLTAISLVGILIMALVAWVAYGPIRTVGSIRQAIYEGDTSQLSRDIDFPRLRVNIKARLSKAIEEELRAADISDEELGGTKIAGLEMLGGAIVGFVIETMISPEAFFKATQGAREIAEQRQQVEESLEKDRGLSFRGVSEAHISYGDEEGTLVLIFERRGLNWVLVDGEFYK